MLNAVRRQRTPSGVAGTPLLIVLAMAQFTQGERARSHALGVYGAVVSTGFASGAVLGGLLVQQNWRLVFFVNAPVGVLLLACYWLLPASAPSRTGRERRRTLRGSSRR